MKRAASFVVVAMLLASQATGAAPVRHVFAVPALPLDAALAQLSAQGGVDIGTAETGLAAVQAAPVNGRLGTAEALRRLLAGTRYRAVAVAGGFRIERAAAVPRPVRPALHIAPVPLRPLPEVSEIVVTASKRPTSLMRFAGGATVIRLNGASGIDGRDTLAGVAAAAPAVQATSLGAGRNKLFVRGIVDSSYLGPTQATTAIYLGNVLLAYNGAAPNLTLYDVDRLEVLEGPQGTLYGAGAIGGVIKVTPRPPDLENASGSAAVGATLTQDGDAGHDMAAMLNLPLLTGRAALRVVAYESRDGGYIDDPGRGLHDINRTETAGARAALRLVPGDGWTVEIGGVAQSIDTPDSQYAVRGVPGLARRSAIAQPFRDDFLLGRLEIAKQWDSGLRLDSATGGVRHTARDRFDATLGRPLPLAYDTIDRNVLVTQETRLSRTLPGGGSWLVGGSLLRDRDVTMRDYGRPGTERAIVGVTNRSVITALFGEATVALTPIFAITAGARVTSAHIDSEPSASRSTGPYLRGRRQLRVDPTFGVSWRVRPHVAIFTRYQSGFRTGGLAVAPGIGRVADFKSDDIVVAEAGVRFERAGPLGLAASIGVSTSRWRNIQADLVDRRGFPFTANVGTGHVTGLEANADWVPLAGLRLNGGIFLADSRSDGPDPEDLLPRSTRLPNTPRFSGSATLAYDWRASSERFAVAGTLRYVGSSFLDPRALLHIRQGKYAELGATLNWQHGPYSVGLDAMNLANCRGDRFALGNPFGVASGDQYTPLRPRSVRLALSRTW